MNKQDSSQCLNCDAPIPANASRCAACGWTWQDQSSDESPAKAPSFDDKKSGENSATPGGVLIVIGIAIGLFAHAHRPPDGFVDAMNRSESWFFKPGVYYVALFIAASCAFAGAMRILKWRESSGHGGARSGGAGSGLDQIKKAKELLDAGAINASEFEKIKKDALER